MTRSRIIFALVTLALAAGTAGHLSAATVRVSLSARETYVGLPVTLHIQVADAKQVDPPTIPALDGIAVKPLGTPSRSTQITSINGRTTTSTTQVFGFELTPQRTGTFQIPAITVNVDGVAQQTRPIDLAAAKSETGDLMFVEIAGKEKQIYVGQALHLTLKIWLRPYNDAARKLTLSEADMWKMISDRSEWGPFAERLQLYADQNRRPSGTEVLRKDRDGVEHSYYLYEIEATIYPKRPGKIDGDNLKLIADYPTALGKARDPFSGLFDDMPFPGGRPSGFGDDDFSPFNSHLVVQSVRPVAAQADVEPIEVLPIPTAGRPADYRGAVGTYHLAVDATPSHVKAGDPINFYIGVSGSGPMELVQAPPLAEVPELTADFKVPSEPLAGLVKGDRKLFSTTIRPRKQGITQIPPIPFTYFDPTAAKFVTVHSAPISIQVDPADMLALDGKASDTKDKNSASPNPQTPSAEKLAASLAVVTGEGLLKNQSVWSLNKPLWIPIFATPPIAVLLILLRRLFSAASFGNWFSSAANVLKSDLTRAISPIEIAVALDRFAARIYKRRSVNADTASIIGAMRSVGARDLAIRLESLLDECHDTYRPTKLQADKSLLDLKQRAQQWAEDVQHFSQRTTPKPNQRTVATSKTLQTASTATPTSLLAIAIIAASFALSANRSAFAESPVAISASTGESSQAVPLNEQQQKLVLTEAAAAYSNALENVRHDAATAKTGFEQAAEKYQLLVDTGIENSRLYFNLGNAYLECGQTGKAIANYHRSLRIDPTFRAAQTNLTLAEQQLHPPKTDDTQQTSSEWFGGISSIASRWLIRNFTPSQVLVAMSITWFALWAVIAVRLLGFAFPWKSTALGLVIATSLLGVSLSQIWPNPAQQLAVIIQPQPANATTADATLSEGQVVELLQQRPDSVRVRTAGGQELWLPAGSIDRI